MHGAARDDVLLYWGAHPSIARPDHPAIPAGTPTMPRRLKVGIGLQGNARLLFAMMFLSELGFGLYYQNLLTVYMEGIGTTPSQIGAIITGTGLVRIALMLPAGSLVDRMPRRRIVIAATSLAIPGALTYAFATTWWHLVVAGLFMACQQLGFPALSGIIADSSENRLDAFRKIYTIAPASAFIIGPMTSGLIADLVSQRAVFMVAAVVFSGSWLLAWRIQEPPAHAHAVRRGSYREVLAHPALRSLYGFKLVAIAALTLGTTLLPNLLKDAHGLDQRTLGYLFSIAAVGSLIMSTVIGRHRRLNSIRGIAIGLLSVAVICWVGQLTGSVFLLGPAFLMRGGFMITWSLFTPLLSDVAPKAIQERSFAAGEFIASTGNTAAPLAAGVMYEANRNLPFAVAGVMLPFLALYALRLERVVIRPAIAREERLRDDGAVPGPAATLAAEAA